MAHPGQTAILVVDDDDGMRELLSFYLGSLGYLVAKARTAAAALIGVRDQQFDLVLSDVEMPGGSGFDLLHDLRVIFPDLSVILITGSPFVTPAMAKERGAAGLIIKPFDCLALRLLITEVLARAAHLPALAVTNPGGLD